MSDVVLTSNANGVLVITLNRPQAYNALNTAVVEGVATALDELDVRDDLTVGVLTGAEGTFSAGMDLKEFVAGEVPIVQGSGLMALTDAPPRKPVIAAVEGYAVAGGCEIVLACDLVVAAKDAHFGIPEVKRGLIAAAGGLVRLPQRLPYHVAMELALTGGLLDAPRAYHFGLVNRLTESGRALDGALELAHAVAANAPLAVRTSKEIVLRSATGPAGEADERQQELVATVFLSDDALEGALAFTEKRSPVWNGC
jgi:enoyl-CoA hydratase